MAKKVDNINNEIDSSNIFDEFVDDSSLIEEVDKVKRDRNRDLFYYISRSWAVLQTIFWLWLIVIIILFSYIYIQKNDWENFKNSNILDPFCIIFLWDIPKNETFCSSISSLKKSYEEELENTENQQVESILGILKRLDEVANFNNTNEVLFLLDKSQNKLKVLNILEKFDNLKNEFDKIDKQKIQCNSLIIDSKKEILSMDCTAYSAWFEKWLRWYDGTVNNLVKWSSLSIANSFLNYIQKQSKDFLIVDRQKIFKSETTIWEKTDFTNKTSFNLKLKYNLK